MQCWKTSISVWPHFRLIKNYNCYRNVFNCNSFHLQKTTFAYKKYIVQHHSSSLSMLYFSPRCRKLNTYSSKLVSCTEQDRKKVKLTVKHAAIEQQGKLVVLTLSDDEDYKFPWLWLRDNCQCAICFNAASYSRTIDWKTFDIKVSPTEILISNDAVHVNWSDCHKSTFSLSWLLKRSFTAAAQEEWLTGTYRLPKVSWGSEEFPHILRRFYYNDVINSDDCLLEWLESLAIHGVAVLENTLCRLDQVRQLVDRVAFIRKTFYGEEFQVIAQPGATNLAYLATPLQMHIDLPYYEHKPGLNFLHCLVQAIEEGGENQLTDGLRVAERLKVAHPDVYKILATTPVEWMDIARDDTSNWFSIHRAPVICEDTLGHFASVNYSQQQRDSHFSVPLELVNKWYEAQALFTQMIHHPDNTVFLKTKPGEILTFDNFRILHGRASYDDKPGQERHLVGAYLDWDYVYSRIRVLRTADDNRRFFSW